MATLSKKFYHQEHCTRCRRSIADIPVTQEISHTFEALYQELESGTKH